MTVCKSAVHLSLKYHVAFDPTHLEGCNKPRKGPSTGKADDQR